MVALCLHWVRLTVPSCCLVTDSMCLSVYKAGILGAALVRADQQVSVSQCLERGALCQGECWARGCHAPRLSPASCVHTG